MGTAVAVVGVVAVVAGLAVMASASSSSSYGTGLGALLIGGGTAGVGLFLVLAGAVIHAASSAEPTVRQSAMSALGPRHADSVEPDVMHRAAPGVFAVVPSLRFSF